MQGLIGQADDVLLHLGPDFASQRAAQAPHPQQGRTRGRFGSWREGGRRWRAAGALLSCRRGTPLRRLYTRAVGGPRRLVRSGQAGFRILLAAPAPAGSCAALAAGHFSERTQRSWVALPGAPPTAAQWLTVFGIEGLFTRSSDHVARWGPHAARSPLPCRFGETPCESFVLVQAFRPRCV